MTVLEDLFTTLTLQVVIHLKQGDFAGAIAAAQSANEVFKKFSPAEQSRQSEKKTQLADAYKFALRLKAESGGGESNSSGGGGGRPPSDDRPVRRLPVKPKTLEAADPLERLPGAEQTLAKLEQNVLLPRRFPRMFAAASTFLMYGPPGTGKTQIARGITKTFRAKVALSNPESIQLFAATGSGLMGKYVGDTQKNIRSWFEAAQTAAEEAADENEDDNAFSILFLDEIDAVAGRRNAPGATENTISSVNEFLQMLDGLENFDRVFTVAATNRPWDLDSAILSRFSLQEFTDMPTRRALINFACAQLNQHLPDGRDSVPYPCKRGVILQLIEQLIELTAIHPRGVANIERYMKANGVTKPPGVYQTWKDWLVVGRGHSVSSNSATTYGFSFRDLNQVIFKEWFNTLAVNKLQSRVRGWRGQNDGPNASIRSELKPDDNCSFLCRPPIAEEERDEHDEEEEECILCDSESTRGLEKGVRLYFEDILEFADGDGATAVNPAQIDTLALDSLAEIIQSTPSSIKSDEYPQFLFYMLTKQTPPPPYAAAATDALSPTSV